MQRVGVVQQSWHRSMQRRIGTRFPCRCVRPRCRGPAAALADVLRAARVRKMMKRDPEVKMATKESAVLLTYATVGAH